MLRHYSFIKALSENLPVTYSENRENLNGDLPHFAPKNDKLPEEWGMKKMSLSKDYFLFRKI